MKLNFTSLIYSKKLDKSAKIIIYILMNCIENLFSFPLNNIIYTSKLKNLFKNIVFDVIFIFFNVSQGHLARHVFALEIYLIFTSS